MMEKDPNNTHLITDLDTLKVVSDPLRIQIIEALILEPMTVNQVAEKLGLTASKLYYHVNLLEKHGLIEVVETRTVSNLIEKYYRSVASRLSMDPALLSFDTPAGQDNIFTMIASTLDTTREDVLRSFQARAFELGKGGEAQVRRAMFTRVISRLTEEKAGEFQSRLDELVSEFEAADVKEPEGEVELQTYAFTLALYPSFYYPNEEV